jgi:hypothetical protein
MTFWVSTLYLSYFYSGFELSARLSWYWVSYQSTQIVSAFFAFGTLRLRSHNGMEGELLRQHKAIILSSDALL